MIGLTRRYRFPAAHVLSHPDLSQDENERIYGKCANPAGHGHDYGLEITVAGPIDPESGRIIDRDVLDALVAAGVKQIVHVSSIAAMGYTPGYGADESEIGSAHV